MSDENKTVKAITRLIEQTQDGQLKWSACHPTEDITRGERFVDTVYVAKKDKRLIRLYGYKDRYYTDEDLWHWSEDVALELSDENQTSWWRFPDHHAIGDLLNAVQFKTVGVDQFIRNLLSE